MHVVERLVAADLLQLVVDQLDDVSGPAVGKLLDGGFDVFLVSGCAPFRLSPCFAMYCCTASCTSSGFISGDGLALSIQLRSLPGNIRFIIATAR
jgi:hypothetical protein